MYFYFVINFIKLTYPWRFNWYYLIILISNAINFSYFEFQEKDFGKLMLHRAHVNPRANLKTSLKAYQKFTLHKAYIGEDVFWATTPAKGDYIQIKLDPPIHVEE